MPTALAGAGTVGSVAIVDVVVVSYNSADTLADCLRPLAGEDWLDVIVVDSASQDGSVEVAAGLPVRVRVLDRNLGFAYGCNRGLEAGSAPYVLFVNPDACIQPAAVRRLVEVLEEDRAVGLVAPRIVSGDGSLEHSQRRFPRLRSTWAQGLLLHRLVPRAGWADELVRDPRAYERPRPVEWVSGACVLLRRDVLERLGGWDEGFFLYCEDVDLCRRLWRAGYEVRFEPSATAVHVGGGSAPRGALLPVLARSRLRDAAKHRGRVDRALDRIGIAVGALVHACLTTKGWPARAGHLRALAVALRPSAGTGRSGRPEPARTAVNERVAGG